MLEEILPYFVKPDDPCQWRELGGGNINDTYLVSTPSQKFVLQRINSHVFADPVVVAENVAAVTRHLWGCDQVKPVDWQDILVVPTLQGQTCQRDSRGDIWRALSYVSDSVSYEQVQTEHQAQQVGRILGCFHRLLLDMPVDQLQPAIPGFHCTPRYLHRLEGVVAAKREVLSPDVQHCLRLVEQFRGVAPVIEQAYQRGQLVQRVVHGDPKVANILFSGEEGRALCLIDLDTVGPGVIPHDVGDCLRSCCNIHGEHAEQPEQVIFDLDICGAVLQGYMAEARTLLTSAEKNYIYHGVHLLSFELGIRYLTDYLLGNVYFKVDDAEDNLHRALVQLQLATTIERQKKHIMAMLAD